MEHRFGEIDKSHKVITTKLKNLGSTMIKLENHMGNIETRMGNMNTSITNMDNSISNLAKLRMRNNERAMVGSFLVTMIFHMISSFVKSELFKMIMFTVVKGSMCQQII
jgi:hypothetical protein